jgi:two-component system, sensor histidine kinase and response regulator
VESLNNKKVLLVDDNFVNLIVAKNVLQRAGIRVTTAENGAAAIEQLNKDSFDAVLMDIQMPVMDGIEATAYIRDTLALKQLPIIAVSANVMQKDIDRSIQAGMVAHIGKPIVSEHLLLTLESHLKSA